MLQLAGVEANSATFSVVMEPNCDCDWDEPRTVPEFRADRALFYALVNDKHGDLHFISRFVI